MLCQDDIQVSTSASGSNAGIDSIVIQPSVLVDDDPSVSEPQLTPLKRSWVWTHFVKNEDGKTVTCNALKSDGSPCGRQLTRDKSSSTKGMIEHLVAVHKLGNPQKRPKTHPPTPGYLKATTIKALEEAMDARDHIPSMQLIAQNDLPTDYSLYLVAGTDELHPTATLESTVRLAIQGGVSVVQLREKSLSTHAFLERAVALRQICRPPVSFIVNDRVDIALAANADGVHLGQDDLPIELARKILGDRATIGVSVNTLEEAFQAAERGANYLGIGTCWKTGSKSVPDHKVIGPRGVKAIRDELLRAGHTLPLVTIGGINQDNLARTLYGCVSDQFHSVGDPSPAIGVAVLSAITSSPVPLQAAIELRGIISQFSDSLSSVQEFPPNSTFISDLIISAFEKHRRTEMHRLIHHITNTVVQNDCANLTLALGCSPIMTSNLAELEDLVEAPTGCLVFNLGTLDENQVQAMKVAGRRANLLGKPIVFDPVGAGASQLRRKTANDILNHVQVSVIKGNQAEIATLADFDVDVKSCGVDSNGSMLNPGRLVLDLARRERCVVAMTGKTDWVSDGSNVFKLENGIPILSSITGSGCMAGSAIGCFASSTPQACCSTRREGLTTLVDHELLMATVIGISSVNVAAEISQQKILQKNRAPSPNSLRTGIIDELYHLTTPVLLNQIKIKKVETL